MILRPLVCLIAVLATTMSSAEAQLGPWTQSPSRPEVWYCYGTPTPGFCGDWLERRSLIQEAYEGLPVEYASITTADEDVLVRALTPTVAFNFGLFIGATDLVVEGEWRWLDGSPFSYTGWGIDPQSESLRHALDFGVIDGSGWGATACNSSGSGCNQQSMWGLHSADCDSNGIPDLWELYQGTAIDLNGNGEIDSCEVVGTNYCVATPNSSGQSARIAAGGSTSLAANGLYLTVFDLPILSPGIFLASQSRDFVPLFGGSQGNLCLGAPISRLDYLPGGIVSSGGTGIALLQLDLAAASAVTGFAPGDTWNFQYWTRDVFTSNTSDGTTLTFR